MAANQKPFTVDVHMDAANQQIVMRVLDSDGNRSPSYPQVLMDLISLYEADGTTHDVKFRPVCAIDANGKKGLMYVLCSEVFQPSDTTGSENANTGNTNQSTGA